MWKNIVGVVSLALGFGFGLLFLWAGLTRQPQVDNPEACATMGFVLFFVSFFFCFLAVIDAFRRPGAW